MFETVKNILLEEYSLDPDQITMESDLRNDLGVNSIELADLIFTCEEKFDVEITDEEALSFITIGDVVRFLEEKAN